METMHETRQALENSRLQKFFIDEIKDIYWAEKHLVKSIPKMQEAAYAAELKQAFAEHLEVTRGHVSRLEEVFSQLGEEAEGKKCDAMAGITEEAEDIIDDTEENTSTRDAGLILAAQKVEHYEISTYGGLISLANTLGHRTVSELLRQTLAEEKQADESLSELAEGGINSRAASEKISEN